MYSVLKLTDSCTQNDEFSIKNDEPSIRNDEFRIQNDGLVAVSARKSKETTLGKEPEFCINLMNLVFKMMNLSLQMMNSVSHMRDYESCGFLLKRGSVVLNNDDFVCTSEMKPGGKIAWEFRLEKKDIGACLYYKFIYIHYKLI